MADKGYTKLKLLHVKEFIEKHSDEEHPVSVEDINDMLVSKGIICERKSIYSDVKTLKEYGMDILSVRQPKTGYSVCCREFELPELRLLIDAVQAANFITPKKTKELIKKIGTLCSVYQAKMLEKQVYIEKRNKCSNEGIYYNIDIINRAIQANRRISFIYQKRQLDEVENQVVVTEKELTVSPYAMIWCNDHYYLVGNNPKYSNLMHTRIDRMKKVEVLEERSRRFSEVSSYKNFFDSADYAGKIFNMYSGDTQTLKMLCDNSILEDIMDRFGDSAIIRTGEDESRFSVRTKCAVSEGLISYIMQFGDKAEVVEPVSLRRQIKSRAEKIAEIYK